MLIAKKTVHNVSVLCRFLLSMAAVEDGGRGVPGDYSSIGVASYVGSYSLLLGLV